MKDLSGIVNVYKDSGMTSHDVVYKIRKISGIKKVGHTGTLDPDAQGVLPVCIGKATKAADMLAFADKRYTATLRLGITTDTQDLSGKVLRQKSVEASDADIAETINEFKGEIYQIPPMYSAVKVGGKKLYTLARQGVEVERRPRKINVYEIAVLGRNGNDLELDVKCSKGTYIRTLCHDIGERLGCGGCMARLVRTQTACFTIDNAVKLDKIERDGIEKYLIPTDRMFDYDKITVSGDDEKGVLNGQSIKHNVIEGKYYRVYGSDGRFLCISEGLKGRLKLVKSFY